MAIVHRPTRDFTLDTANVNSSGIALAAGFAYVVDATDNKVYVYELTASGATYRSARDFNLESANSDAQGITIASGFAYVVDATGNKVYVYELTSSGATYRSARDFNLESANADPSGITVVGTYAYIGDSGDNKVYVYELSSTGATYREARNFDLVGGNDDAVGLAIREGFAYAVDSTDRKVYTKRVPGFVDVTAPTFVSATTNGLGTVVTLTMNEFLNEGSIPDPSTFTLSPTKRISNIYVTGSTIELTLSRSAPKSLGAQDTNRSFVPSVNSGYGLDIANGFLYIVEYSGGVQVYELSSTGATYQSARSFTVESTNVEKGGIAIYNGFAYIPDFSVLDDDFLNAYVFAYELSATGATYRSARSFYLEGGNSSPNGITIDNGLVYVLDSQRDKVFVYAITETGAVPRSERDFECIKENASPEAISVANGFAYVADNNRKVYVYALSSSGASYWTTLDLVAGVPLDVPRGLVVDNNFLYTIPSGRTTQDDVYRTVRVYPLTYTQGFSGSDTITVAYTQPSTNPLEDIAGNDVATFTAQPVTNALTTAPGPVTNLAESTKTTTTIIWEWDAPSTGGAPDSYEYRYIQGSGTPTGAWTTAGRARNVLIESLSPSTTYTIQVRARNVQGAGNTVTDSATTQAAPTTVTVNAGANVTVASGGTVMLSGMATVVNGVGATVYGWIRVSGTGGAFTPTDAAKTTFTAPTLNIGDNSVMIVLRLTVTNNGVSDTDDVTITVTAPLDTTAPTFSSAATDTAGTTLTITFSEALSTSHVPASSAFTLSPAKTISNVQVTGSTVVLTTAAFAHDDTITVAYTKPSSNPLQDASGNETATFTAKAVTNNVPVPLPVAEAPTVSINTVSAGDENTTVVLGATIGSDGTYDGAVEYAWTVSGGALNDATLAGPTWTRPTVSTNTDYTINLQITVRGTGTNARASTSDTATATAVQSTVRNVDTTAPTLSGASTDTGGTFLTLEFTEALDPNHVPAASAFTLSPARTISNVLITGSNVFLQVSPLYLRTDTITVAYTKPSTNPLQDASGNEVATFTAQGVANNAPLPVAAAPTVTIAPVDAGQEGTAVQVSATLGDDGTYDGDVEYAWTVEAGGLNDATLAAPTWTRPLVTANTDYTIDLQITVRGTGTNARSNTSDTADAAQVTTTVQDSSDADTTPPTFSSAETNGAGTTITLTFDEELDTNSVPAVSAFTVAETTPDTTAPTFSSAATDDSGTAITLTFSEALDVSSTPASSAFTVSPVKAISNVQVTGSTVILTTGMFASSDTITVAYTKPSSNPLQDAAGNDVTTFSAQPVTNHILPPASAPSLVTIAAVAAGNEGTTASLSASINNDGTYDGNVEYAWTVSGGALNDATLATPTWTRPLVDANTDYTIDLRITVRGNGTNAQSGTVDTVDAAQITTTVNDVDTTAPIFSGAATNAAGTTLTITFSEALSTSHVPASSAFTLSPVKTISNVQVTGSTVVLTTAAYEHGDTITVAYTKPSNNPLQDPSGNEVATFSAQGVTNNVPDTTPPMVVSATTNTAGTRVTLTFDEALGSGLPATSAFTLSPARTIAGVSSSGANVVLSLSMAYTSDDVITVSYTRPVGNFLNDAAGNAVASFTDQAVTNTVPDNVAPTLVSAATTTLGTQMTLTFSEALDETSTPASSAFTFSPPRSVTEASIDGSTATVNIAGYFEQGEVITVSYTRPSTNPLQDEAGNDVATFTAQPVTNNVEPREPFELVYLSGYDLSIQQVDAAQGIDVAHGYAYIVDYTDLKVYVFTASGTYTSARDFNLNSNNGGPTGVGIENGFAYVLDNGDDKVYVYELSNTGATYRSARDFNLTSTNQSSQGLGVSQGYAYVVDVIRDKVFVYELSSTGATYRSARDFALNPNNTDPQGISVANGFAYVMDSTLDRVFVYELSAAGGVYVRAFDVRDDDNGIAVHQNKLYLVDAGSAGTVSIYDVFTNAVDTTAPTFSSATTDAAGTTLTLTFDEALDVNSVPASSAFTLSPVKAISNVQVTGATVVLTTAAFADGDTITVAYTAPTAYPLQDVVGNDVATFTAQAVTNAVAGENPTFSSAATDVSGTQVTLTFSEALDENSVPAVTAFVVDEAVSDTTAPTLLSAQTNADGTSVILAFSENLDPNSAPATSDFTLSPSKAIANVFITGSTVVLTTAAFADSDTITVTYTGSATSPLQDLAGNNVASFANQAVTNNRPPTYVSGSTQISSIITLVFSSNLDVGSTPDASAFTLSPSRTITAVTIPTVARTEVILAVSPGYSSGDTITVSYTKPATNPLQSASGVDVEAFSNEPITNTL